MDKDKIERQAKEILDKFAKALSKVELKEEQHFVDRDEFERKEGSGVDCEGFKEKLLGNAPHKNKDFVIVEKGEWKQ